MKLKPINSSLNNLPKLPNQQSIRKKNSLTEKMMERPPFPKQSPTYIWKNKRGAGNPHPTMQSRPAIRPSVPQNVFTRYHGF